jgi:phosphoserine phosphatase
LAVRVMSGGLLPAVVALASALGIESRDVAAVGVCFDDRGVYAGFDDESPLARSGGKRAVLERWAPDLPRPILMVGDGATDLEARPPADYFLAFAGITEREAVVADADVVLRTRSLAPVLPLALGGDPPAWPESRPVFEVGRRLLDAHVRHLSRSKT